MDTISYLYLLLRIIGRWFLSQNPREICSSWFLTKKGAGCISYGPIEQGSRHRLKDWIFLSLVAVSENRRRLFVPASIWERGNEAGLKMSDEGKRDRVLCGHG